MNPGTLLIRADADARIGTGHVMRCLALAQAWQDVGGNVSWAAASLPPSLEHRLAAEHIELIQTPLGATALEAVTRQLAAAWVVIDGYSLGADHQLAGRAAGARVLVVDDDAALGEYTADVLVDPNLFASQARYEKHARRTHLLMGCKYALLRRELVGGGPPMRSASASRVLFTFGGADPARLSELSIDAVHQMKSDVDATLLIGGANPRRIDIDRVASGHPQLRVVYDEVDMRSRMESTDIAVSAAGGTCLELAFMGVPTIAVVTADNQRRVAEALVTHGVAHSLGAAESVTARTMARALDALLADQPERASMSSRGRQLVDGRGAQRVVAAMLEAA